MARPQVARKKPVVLSDSEQDKSRSPPHKRNRRGTRTTAPSDTALGDSRPVGSHSSRAAVSRRSKPAEDKAYAKAPVKSKSTYKPINSFFTNVQSLQPIPSLEKATSSLQAADDILDTSDEDGIEPDTTSSMRKSANATIRQRFLHPTHGIRSTPPLSQPVREKVEDQQPWAEKYGPASLDELAVHKKKTADIQEWLTDAFRGKERKRLLLLKGPAGSGKTATMTLLSRHLGCTVHEWKNPADSMPISDTILAAAAQFEDFIRRAATFGSLTFDVPSPPYQQSSAASQVNLPKQLVLVEEFPNTFARTSSALRSFRSVILKYLAEGAISTTASFSNSVCQEQAATPIVMIISETLLTTNTAAADSFTAHRLLGSEILTHPGVTVIEFNPIAPTYMVKALNTVVLKEAQRSGRRKTVGSQVIQQLAELGDIRSAVSSLEFLCLRGDDVDGWSGKVNFSKKKSASNVAMTTMERDSLIMVTQRESTLGIFHSVGRVVYNKRLLEGTGASIPQPPNWCPEKRRPKASEVNVETLINELGTDAQTFVAALHENYVLSCRGTDSEETMDSIEGCVEALSDADLLSLDRFSAGAGRRNFQGTSIDNQRQDEMCVQACVRGLLFHLPSPVKRAALPSGIAGTKFKGQGTRGGALKGNAFVMYYPVSLRIWKQQEETKDLLDMWISRMQTDTHFATAEEGSQSAMKSGTVESWGKKSSLATTSLPAHFKSSKDCELFAPVLLGSGGSARYEMLLERLPYLTFILEKRHAPWPSQAAIIREMQRVTSFDGENSSHVEHDNDGDENDEHQRLGECEQWSTDKSATGSPRKNRRSNFKHKEGDQDAIPSGLGNQHASLVLSDDDIED